MLDNPLFISFLFYVFNKKTLPELTDRSISGSLLTLSIKFICSTLFVFVFYQVRFCALYRICVQEYENHK